MTRPADNERNKAAAVFATVLTLAAGGAGLVVAGLILGTDYLLHGHPDERQRLAEQRTRRSRDRYTDALAWLEADRVDRARHRRAVREWFEADPAARGGQPSSGETFGRTAARCWNALIVGAHRFRHGWRDGLAQARAAREAGKANWWRPDGPDRPTVTDPAPSDNPAPTPSPDASSPEPEPNRNQQRPTAGDVIDAEIVEDPPVGSREVVRVGEDAPTEPDPTLDEYGRRIDTLADEVAHGRGNTPVDPSPPRPALP